MRNLPILYRGLFAAVCLILGTGGTARALPAQTAVPMTGEIEAITLTAPNNVWSGGTMTVGGQLVILPANLLINLPNDYQTLQQLFTNAPAACLATGESGLAKSDRCNQRATGAQATILANRTDSGNVIAGQVDVFKALESVTGTVTYLSYSDGFFRVNGNPGDPNTGVMVRVNDPPVGNPALGRHTVQKGLGCAAGNTVNCSPDVRFKVDPDNYTFSYITGYPACIPTTANGLGDPNCPDSNRPPIADIVGNNPPAAAPVAADSRRFAPVKAGDSVKADGSFETVSGVTFLSAASVRVFVDLTTRTTNNLGQNDPTQPDYLIILEAGWDGPAYPAGRVRGRFLTNASFHATNIDYYSVHYDPINNAPHEQILYTTQGNRQQGPVVFNVPTGVFDSQIRMDFFNGAKVLESDPCYSLTQGFTSNPKNFTAPPVIPGVNLASYCTSSPGTAQDFVDNFNLMAPVFREVMARSVRQRATTGVALDIHGRPTQSGQYKLPTTIAYGAFEDINLGMSAFPHQFSGTPWLMDRRLSPNGCVGACEAAAQPLTPFPFEGIDPTTVVTVFGPAVPAASFLPTPNRMFRFMDAAGKFTGLLSWPPSNPPAFPILATPGLSLFPPFADEDAASTRAGIPVIIPVLANDISIFGTIDSASVKLASAPASGTVQVNPNGTITYTPTPSATGTISFTYTVANNFGSVSLPGTVTVSIVAPPIAVPDTASVPAKSSQLINLTANDLSGTSLLNIASVTISSAPSCGTLVNQLDGMVLFTAPPTVPAGGSCSFAYVVSDASTPPLVSNPATVTVTIGAANVAPFAANDFAAALVGTTVTINLTGNDTASAPDIINPASLVLDTPTGGSVISLGNGSVSYTAPGQPGTYFFAYTVQDTLNPPLTSNPGLVVVTVNALNTPPVAVNDSAGTVIGTPIAINVLANDSSVTSTLDPASIILSVPAGNGSASALNGVVTYTPPALAGVYSFSYTVKDKSAPPLASNPATVTVTVAATNANPVALPDTASTTVGSTITIPVLANDSSSTSTLNPASLILSATNGGTATPNANGTVSYTAPNLAGSYSFTYTVKDNFAPTPGISAPATVTITVAPASVAPSANPDAALASTGSTVNINLIANDTPGTSAINPASLTLSAPSGGSAVALANGTVNYTAPSTAGVYSFSYTVKDSAATPLVSNSAAVTVTVSAPFTAPSAINDAASTRTNTPITINLIANDTAGTNPIAAASVAIASAPLHGTALANGDGTVTYTPTTGFSGADSFSYTVKDSGGASSNVASVALTVTAQTIAISRAQFTVASATWRVDGTITPAPPAGTTLTIYNNTTAGSAQLVTGVAVNGNAFTWQAVGAAPNAARRISVRTSQTPPSDLNGIVVTLR
jgi:hypothetical protein